MKNFDSESSSIHNEHYKTTGNLEASRDLTKKYEEDNVYAKNGFEAAVQDASQTIGTHIDLGCGTGWLMIKTSPSFKRVIGIDPAEDGIRIAKELTRDIPNLEYLEKDMITALKDLSITEPVFLTTGIVLSHINNAYVIDFLHFLNTLPTGSMLYFDEPYGVNIDQKMWHVRSKKWWADNLSDWNLKFGTHTGEYTYGINGTRVGKENRTELYAMSAGESAAWFFNGVLNKIKRVFRFIKRKIGISV